MGEDQSQTGRREPRRVTVAEASEILGITVEAVRGRIKRDTLDHERTDKGVFVFLEADQSADRPRPDSDQTTDRLRSDATALISAKDETIAAMRDQLEAERQAQSEVRRLLAAALERLPSQLEEAPMQPPPPPPPPPRTDNGDREGALRTARSIVTWMGGVAAPLAVSVFSAMDDRYQLALVFGVFAALTLLLIAIGAYIWSKPRSQASTAARAEWQAYYEAWEARQRGGERVEEAEAAPASASMRQTTREEQATERVREKARGRGRLAFSLVLVLFVVVVIYVGYVADQVFGFG